MKFSLKSWRKFFKLFLKTIVVHFEEGLRKVKEYLAVELPVKIMKILSKIYIENLVKFYVLLGTFLKII